ncbi:Hsp20/alpha crystallin family protein [Mycetocola sp.]|uniref:Hsp20/alpha crystallin family protein n=1 Tax=Mycetocola sp. TaxID=1871042 RepID=UPI00398957EF
MARNFARFNPLAELDALQRQVFGEDFLTRFTGGNTPTTDVYTENDSQLTIEAHLPNFSEADIDVAVDEGALVIQAEKREKEEDKGKKYMVRESSTSFYRRITLPERADESSIDARFENGVLKIVIPFRELASPKKIRINTSGQSTPPGTSSERSRGTASASDQSG